ncbi:MAG TPA: hypothetical protein VFO29_08735 [Candidatus Rubrimentiphilum sp.]|nr:hypothetical protein [Candidatus Rubrimentiphilum sp.]
MAVYILAVIAQAAAFNFRLVPSWLVIPVALVPIVPAVFAAIAVIDRMRLLDELQRSIQSEGIQFSFLITAILTLSYGFLESFAHFPRLSMSLVMPVLVFTWAVGLAIASRRYS